MPKYFRNILKSKKTSIFYFIICIISILFVNFVIWGCLVIFVILYILYYTCRSLTRVGLLGSIAIDSIESTLLNRIPTNEVSNRSALCSTCKKRAGAARHARRLGERCSLWYLKSQKPESRIRRTGMWNGNEETYTCKRPTRVIYIYEYKNTKFPRIQHLQHLQKVQNINYGNYRYNKIKN